MDSDELDIQALLHPRLKKRCAQVYADGHFREAVQLAMTVVECAIREAAGVTNRSGVRLVDELLGEGQGVKLRLPLPEDLRDAAWLLFRGAFKYYRNASSHDASQFEQVTALRALILASELLDLIGASRISFEDIGGVEGLIRQEIFKSGESLAKLLRFLDGHTIVNLVVDGFYESLYRSGFDDDQLQAVLDLGLAEYSDRDVVPTTEELLADPSPAENIGQFALTELGKAVLTDQTSNPVPPN